MGFLDKLKDLASKNTDKVDMAIEKAGDLVDKKTQGKYAEAATSLSRLVQSDPKNYRLYLELAECYLNSGERQRAIETLSDFQKMGIRNQLVSEMLDKIRN